MRDFRASAVQMKSGRDRAANLELVDALVRRAAGDGSSLIVLPELFSWRGPQDQELENSEPIPGPSYDTVAALALELGVFIVAGSLLERGKDSDTRCFNTCVFFGPGGEELARYRKIHLFDVDLPGEVTVRESLTRQAGAEVICVATELATVGLSI
ncbi:MAG: nitrilase-related carbon-nitrogen hydrolase, partial [Candidatus Binatia bacterium]